MRLRSPPRNALGGKIVAPTPVDEQALAASRDNPPRVVENLDNVSPDRGRKPTKHLFRGGQRI